MISFFPIFMVLAGSFIGAIGALVIKKGTNRFSLYQFLRTSYFWLGIMLYGVSVIFYIIALRLEELSVLYPLVSTTYLWTTFFSVKFLRETMNGWKWIGLLGIVLGVALIGMGS